MGALALAAVLAAPGCRTETHEEAAPRIRIDAERHRVELFDDDHGLGGEQPLVTVVVFTDYACPPCGRTWQVMDNLVEDYGADLRVVYRAYTVPGFGHGEQAAEAAYAAGAQGKFWEMHSLPLRPTAALLGAFFEPRLGILHAAGFVVRPQGTVATACYATGPIGRLEPGDVLGAVRFWTRHG